MCTASTPALCCWALHFLGPWVLFPLGNSKVTGSRVVQHCVGSLWQSGEALTDGRRLSFPSLGLPALKLVCSLTVSEGSIGDEGPEKP